MGLEFSLNQCTRLGGILAIAIYLLTIGVFMARLANRPWPVIPTPSFCLR